MDGGSFPELRNTIAVVTGGSKGIGAACVRKLADLQVKVALFDIDRSAGETLAKEVDGEVHFFEVDVAKYKSVQRGFAEVASRIGPPARLVNNAGIQHYGSVTETTESDWDRVLNTNLKSAFLCAKEAIPHMQQLGGGVIVNVASVQSFLSQSSVAPYTTSKTALLGLTRSIAVDYAPGIRCVAVCPGTVDTPMLQEAIHTSPDPQAVLEECYEMHPLQRIGDPAEIADFIVYLLSDKASFITGQAMRIDGGLGLSIGGSARKKNVK